MEPSLKDVTLLEGLRALAQTLSEDAYDGDAFLVMEAIRMLQLDRPAQELKVILSPPPKRAGCSGCRRLEEELARMRAVMTRLAGRLREIPKSLRRSQYKLSWRTMPQIRELVAVSKALLVGSLPQTTISGTQDCEAGCTAPPAPTPSPASKVS